MAIKLVNLPWQHEGNVRTRYYESDMMSKCFPIERFEDARGGVICAIDDFEILLLGQVKDYVIEKNITFLDRIRQILRQLVGAADDATGSHGILYDKSISDSTLAFFRDAFSERSNLLENWQVYSVRVGDNVNHGVVARGKDALSGITIQRGYVSLNLVPRYNFKAWAEATVKSYEKYSKADGYPRMLDVVRNAEAAFYKSRAVRADFFIFENRVLPAGTKFHGSVKVDQQGHPLRGILQTHVDFCKGHPYLYAPMLVPIRGDGRPWEQNTAERAWMGSSYGVGNMNYGFARHCTIFTTKPHDETNEMYELESQGTLTKDTHAQHQRPDRFLPGNEIMLQVLKKMLPDLRILAGVADITDEQFKSAHIAMISPTYRDATGAEEPSGTMKQDEAAAFIRAQESTYKGKRNLVKLPELLGNTLALYSYIAGEAMAEYQSWNESEFLDLLDVAFATWAPSKESSAQDAINKFCGVLGCPEVTSTKYEFTTETVFVAG